MRSNPHSEGGEPESGASPGVGPAPVWLLAAALLACGIYLFAEGSLLGGRFGFPLDDSWIHLQFARNLAHGCGLSYNPGELVTGSTAPLWTALLSLLFLLPGSLVLWTKALGVALHLAGVDAVWRLARTLGLGPRGAALAALLHLSTAAIVWSALSGMEIPLFVALSTWGLLLHLEERTGGSGATRFPRSLPLFAIAALARPEGLLLLVLAAGDRLLALATVPVSGEKGPASRFRWPALRPLVTGLALAGLALAGPVLFYRWAGGSYLPTTFAAKGGGHSHALVPNLQYLHTVFGILFLPQPWIALAAGAGAVRLAARLGTPRDSGLLPALWLVGLPVAYSFLTPGPTRMLGNFGRYYFPLFPVLIVLGVLGLAPLGAAISRLPLRGGVRAAVAGLGIALLLAPTLARFAQGASLYAQNVANVEDSDVQIAHWLAERLPPQAVLAVNDIGAIKFLLPNPIVDLASIATPEIGREIERDEKRGLSRDAAMLAAIERRRPDYIAIFPRWVPAVGSDPRFREIYRLPIPGNITMGDDQIVVYATPWSRWPEP